MFCPNYTILLPIPVPIPIRSMHCAAASDQRVRRASATGQCPCPYPPHLAPLALARGTYHVLTTARTGTGLRADGQAGALGWMDG